MRLIGSGGGDRNVSYPLDERFCSWFSSSSRILYWPMAMDGSGPTYAECLDWLKGTLAPFGITHIEMWEGLNERRPEELRTFDGLYIGGGNTFRLLRQVRESGWFDPLRDTLKRGLPTFGGSAGAILLGKDILTSPDLDPHPESPLNTEGLDLLNGVSLGCHYTTSEDPKIRAYVEEYHVPVVACPEASGVVVESGRVSVAGLESSYRFDSRGKEEIRPGSSLTLASDQATWPRRDA